MSVEKRNSIICTKREREKKKISLHRGAYAVCYKICVITDFFVKDVWRVNSQPKVEFDLNIGTA